MSAKAEQRNCDDDQWEEMLLLDLTPSSAADGQSLYVNTSWCMKTHKQHMKCEMEEYQCYCDIVIWKNDYTAEGAISWQTFSFPGERQLSITDKNKWDENKCMMSAQLLDKMYFWGLILSLSN